MRRKCISFLFILFLPLLGFSANTKEHIDIGVLAHKNYESTHSMWDATAQYLNERIPEYEFHIIPLRFNEFPLYLQEKKINFIITNSAYYVDLEFHFGISRIATLKNSDLKGEGLTEFGGVIFARQSSGISTLNQIRHKRFAAVDEESFGGWLMAERELRAFGIEREDMDVHFYGTHESVVRAVMDGKADVGTVRTDTLERMAHERKIRLEDFRIINPKNYANFGYLISTRLYPEWPIATAKNTPASLAEKVAVALISMPSDAKAAHASKAQGWTIPLDYQSIHECLKELGVGPYQHSEEDALSYFLNRYGIYIVAGGIGFMLLGLITLYIARINGRLHDAQSKLVDINLSLEDKVSEKTRYLYEKSEQLEKAYENEMYLRSILRTVADVNQLLITTRNVDELVDKATICLSSNASFKNAKISLVREGELNMVAFHGEGKIREITSIEAKAFSDARNVMITDTEGDALSESCRSEAQKLQIRGIYVLPLKSSNYGIEPLGVLTICTGKEGFSIEEQKMIEELAGDIGFAINAFEKQRQIDLLNEERLRSYQSFIEAMINMIEQRDTYTAGHTERVALYAERIAQELELPEKEISRLVAAAKLHDIGKVVTPDSILLKPGALSGLEYELIKEHVLAGYEVLSTIHAYKELAEIVLCHHERYDGSGYPYGKKGGEISMLGHILAVADSFDAMTTNRIYKPKKPVEEAIRELAELSGRWYHPAVVNAAVTVLESVYIPTETSQEVSTLLEQERMSYFFKDRLTDLYNEEYFSMTLQGRARHPKPQGVWIVSFDDFHTYNKHNGWESGNRLLKRFAAFLRGRFPDRLIFRVWGDQFVIADDDGEIEPSLSDALEGENKIHLNIRKVQPLPDDIDELIHKRT